MAGTLIAKLFTKTGRSNNYTVAVMESSINGINPVTWLKIMLSIFSLCTSSLGREIFTRKTFHYLKSRNKIADMTRISAHSRW